MERQKQRLAYILSGSTIAILLVILAVPFLYNVYISLHDYSLFGGDPSYVGFDNYAEAISNPRWAGSLYRTLLFVALTVGLQFVLGVSVALLLYRLVGRLNVVQVVFLLPMMISEVVAALGFRLMLASNVSVINWALGLVGIPPQQWFGPRWAFATIVAVDVWQHTPFVILIMFAALQTLPQDLLDAAEVDGARGLKRLRYVLFPLLQPAILVVLMFRTIFAVRVFTQVWVLTAGGPANRTAVLGVDIYRTAFNTYDIGMASTLSILLAIASLIIGYAYIRLLSRDPLN